MRRFHVTVLIYLLILFIPLFSLAEDTTAPMIQFWKDRANQGDALPPFQLGFSYEKGQDVKKDLVEAAKWYRLGAERGDFQAALRLADMYIKGEGVQKNEEEAIQWYVKIAKSEGLPANIARLHLLVLARNYSLGSQGVNQNKAKASALFDSLFEIEKTLMERSNAQMNDSIQKFNEAADSFDNMMKKK